MMMLIQRVTTQLMMRTAREGKISSANDRTKEYGSEKIKNHWKEKTRALGSDKKRDHGSVKTKDHVSVKTRDHGSDKIRNQWSDKATDNGSDRIREDGCWSTSSSFRRQRGVRARRGESIKSARPNRSYASKESNTGDISSDESGYSGSIITTAGIEGEGKIVGIPGQEPSILTTDKIAGPPGQEHSLLTTDNSHQIVSKENTPYKTIDNRVVINIGNDTRHRSSFRNQNTDIRHTSEVRHKNTSFRNQITDTTHQKHLTETNTNDKQYRDVIADSSGKVTIHVPYQKKGEVFI